MGRSDDGTRAPKRPRETWSSVVQGGVATVKGPTAGGDTHSPAHPATLHWPHLAGGSLGARDRGTKTKDGVPSGSLPHQLYDFGQVSQLLCAQFRLL